MTTPVTYPSPEGPIDAALARPEGPGPFPAVLMLTDIRGLRDVYRAMADRLAGHGYAVLVPDLYHRLGDSGPRGGEDMTDPAVRERAMGWKASLTHDRIVADMTAAVAFLDTQPFVRAGKLGIVGYCMSGGFAMWAAAALPDRIAAVASFHGGDLASDKPDSPHRFAGKIAAELYFGHADNDAMIPPEMIARLESALADAGARFTSELYAGARHGYAIADGPAYDEAAAERHWTALTGLLERNL